MITPEYWVEVHVLHSEADARDMAAKLTKITWDDSMGLRFDVAEEPGPGYSSPPSGRWVVRAHTRNTLANVGRAHYVRGVMLTRLIEASLTPPPA